LAPAVVWDTMQLTPRPVTGKHDVIQNPEVCYNFEQLHQRRTEPQPQATSTTNLAKFRRVVPEIRVRTVRHIVYLYAELQAWKDVAL